MNLEILNLSFKDQTQRLTVPNAAAEYSQGPLPPMKDDRLDWRAADPNHSTRRRRERFLGADLWFGYRKFRFGSVRFD